MGLKILFISSFHQVWTKIFFLIVFESALEVGISVGSEVVNLLMLVARACLKIVDFIIISETKSNSLVIYW